MPAKDQVTLEEYLAIQYDDRSEPDYVDGEVVERGLPTKWHGIIQSLLTTLFLVLKGRIPLVLMSEVRAQLGPKHFRIIDFAVYLEMPPGDRYVTSPAYVAIEIVSPDDRYSRITRKLEEYRRWGVQHVWLDRSADPEIVHIRGRRSQPARDFTAAGVRFRDHCASDLLGNVSRVGSCVAFID